MGLNGSELLEDLGSLPSTYLANYNFLYSQGNQCPVLSSVGSCTHVVYINAHRSHTGA